MGLREVQAEQDAFDKRYWEHDGSDSTVIHVGWHLGKLLGKVAAYCEELDHGGTPDPSQIVDEVIPDLVSHSARLSRTFGVDLYEAYKLRLDRLEEGFKE